MKPALLLATVSLVGCGGGEARARSVPTATVPREALRRRAGPGADAVVHGVRRDEARRRGARHGLPRSGFARRGFHVLLVDLRAFGLSHRGPYGGPRGARADVRGAVGELKRLGAKRVVADASYGGVVALVAAPALGSQITAVASLSGETSLGGGPSELNALAAVRRIRVPLLIMGSREDRYLSEAEARQFVRAAGSTQVSLAEFDGTFNGWDLLSSSLQRRRADDILVEFLRRQTE